MSGERPGNPDGMKVDMEGNVYCTGPRWYLDTGQCREPPGHNPDQGDADEYGLGRRRLVNHVLYHASHAGPRPAEYLWRACATRSTIGWLQSQVYSAQKFRLDTMRDCR